MRTVKRRERRAPVLPQRGCGIQPGVGAMVTVREHQALPEQFVFGG